MGGPKETKRRDWPAELADDLTLLVGVEIVTTRYAGFQREHGVPIRTTVGAPRYWRGSDQGDLIYVYDIAPHGVFKNPKLKTLEAQERAYHERCDELRDSIVQTLAQIAREHPGETICLLCFENVHEGQVCHRRWFADWFALRFGVVIDERQA